MKYHYEKPKIYSSMYGETYICNHPVYINGLYPTVTIRQIMWQLRMKPLPRKRWETYFDRKEI